MIESVLDHGVECCPLGAAGSAQECVEKPLGSVSSPDHPAGVLQAVSPVYCWCSIELVPHGRGGEIDGTALQLREHKERDR